MSAPKWPADHAEKHAEAAKKGWLRRRGLTSETLPQVSSRPLRRMMSTPAGAVYGTHAGQALGRSPVGNHPELPGERFADTQEMAAAYRKRVIAMDRIRRAMTAVQALQRKQKQLRDVLAGARSLQGLTDDERRQLRASERKLIEDGQRKLREMDEIMQSLRS